MKNIIRFLYKVFINEIYIPWNVFPNKDVGDDDKNIKGEITIFNDKNGNFLYLDIESPEGFHSYEYFSYPHLRYNYKVKKQKARIHSFAYKIKEEII